MEMPARGRRPDFILFFIVLVLIAFGTVMIYSSSYMLALQKYGDGYYFLKKQLFFLVIGLAIMIALMKMPYTWLRRVAYAGMGVSLVLLAVIFIPGIGVTKGGARRWLNLGFFTFQAAELVKVLVVVFLAHYLTRKSAHIQEFVKGFLVPLAVVMVPVALIVKQPDFGSAVLIVAVALSVLYIAGTRFRYLAGSALALVPVAVTLVMMKGYRMDRWNTFLDPWKDPQHKGFQIIQSFLSFGSGGPFGVGLGDGMQKLFYLPEPHTDFILSIIAEESGFIGICTVIVLFGLLIFRGFVIAFRVQDNFGSLLASGITILLAMEAFINIAGVMGLIPTKGMALPFLSYGGTALIVSCMAVGILLNLSTYQKSASRGAHREDRDRGGGTGGHLFPGVAIAEEFRRRDSASDVLFIGTNRGLEARVLPQIGFDLATLDVEGVKGRGIVRSAAALAKIPRSLLQSRRIIGRFAPDVVIGVGGYASGPAVLAAHFMGLPTAIAEQNAIPGETNRILGKFADRIFVSFPETARRFRPDRVRVTGNPIRAAITAAPKRARKPGDTVTVLVFGGSQGAHRINLAVLEALPHLAELKERIRIIHQTGKDDLEMVKKGYGDQSMGTEVLPFITDMASAYGKADLLVCRAGATSIAEITASGKAAVFIPFPHAVNDHQTKNAELLVNRGAAEMIPERELSGERLSGVIRRLAQSPAVIEEMERKAAELGNVRAAADIVDECIELVKRAGR